MIKSFGRLRFEAPLATLSELLTKSRYQKDKALGFYKNHGRDTLFRLEGLCRLYREVLDKKFFERWYKEFKILEDGLGSIDENYAMLQEFSRYKELKKSAVRIMGKRLDEEISYVGDLLRSEGWINGEKLEEFREGLDKVEWKDDDQDRIVFASVMCEEMDKVVNKYRSGEIDTSLLDEGIHEFRRRLRWVGIYAQGGNGLIQLRMTRIVPRDMEKYHTPEIVDSQFNAMSKPIKGQAPVVIQSHYFYAMSWLIQQLGTLKDIGLRHEAYKEVARAAGIKDQNIHKRFLSTCKVHPHDIFTTAEQIIDEFIYRDIVPERICRDIMRSVS